MPEKFLFFHGMDAKEYTPWEDSWVNVIKKKLKHDITYDTPDYAPYFGGDDAATIFLNGVGKMPKKAETAEFIISSIENFKPEVIIAHSLGSILLFYALSNYNYDKSIFKNITLITIGSQVSNNLVSDSFSSRENWDFNPKNIKFWYNLYNDKDKLPLIVDLIWVKSLINDNDNKHLYYLKNNNYFEEIHMSFNKDTTNKVDSDNTPHSAYNYLNHQNTSSMWQRL